MPENAARILARRLRALRERQWPDVVITQRQLADVLGARKPASVPLISSWENQANPVVPPPDRIAAYARFFATRRSIEHHPYRLLLDDELTPGERAAADRLERELLDLRDEAAISSASGGFLAGSPWHFPDGMPITLICSELPSEMRATPLADPDNPDHNELYTFADIDSLVELHGHIRAVNPASEVFFRSSSKLQQDDFTTHLVVLGGVDWNLATKDLVKRLPVPVIQGSREGSGDAHFLVEEGGERREFHPKFKTLEKAEVLFEDVAHFVRGRNPYDRRRTVSICNGMYSPGVLGAVRALTDARFRDRNAEFLDDRFSQRDTYSVLFRVSVVKGRAVTPDWAEKGTVLHLWSANTDQG